MKIQRYLIFISCIIFFNIETVTKDKQKNSPITLHQPITVNLTQNQIQKNKAELQTITSVRTTFKQYNIKQRTQELLKSSWNHIQLNKKKILIFSCASAYFFLIYTIYRTQLYLSNQDRWMYWKDHLTFERLTEIPQKEIAKELLFDIQKKYASIDNLDNFIEPLIYFLNEIDIELHSIEQLEQIYKYLGRIYFLRFVPNNKPLIEQNKIRKQRILYLKNLLINWISEHKINAYTRAKKRMRTYSLMRILHQKYYDFLMLKDSMTHAIFNFLYQNIQKVKKISKF